jgi:hypothetical protein
LDRGLRTGYLMNSFRGIEVKGSCPPSVTVKGRVKVIPTSSSQTPAIIWRYNPG